MKLLSIMTHTFGASFPMNTTTHSNGTAVRLWLINGPAISFQEIFGVYVDVGIVLNWCKMILFQKSNKLYACIISIALYDCKNFVFFIMPCFIVWTPNSYCLLNQNSTNSEAVTISYFPVDNRLPLRFTEFRQWIVRYFQRCYL